MPSFCVPYSRVCIHNDLATTESVMKTSYFHFIIITAPVIADPCLPSPCGPNSQCRQSNGHAICSCINGYIGAPPTCRPECAVSSDCAQDKACSNQKCRDPCPGTCGNRANCDVINHNPICSCPNNLVGDPFIQCSPMRKNIILIHFTKVVVS